MRMERDDVVKRKSLILHESAIDSWPVVYIFFANVLIDGCPLDADKLFQGHSLKPMTLGPGHHEIIASKSLR